MGSLSKWGNRYLRTLLILGGRAVVHHADKKKDAQSLWTTQLKNRRGNNIAAVAVANKNTRVIWALLAHDDVYRKAA